MSRLSSLLQEKLDIGSMYSYLEMQNKRLDDQRRILERNYYSAMQYIPDDKFLIKKDSDYTSPYKLLLVQPTKSQLRTSKYYLHSGSFFSPKATIPPRTIEEETEEYKKYLQQKRTEDTRKEKRNSKKKIEHVTLSEVGDADLFNSISKTNDFFMSKESAFACAGSTQQLDELYNNDIENETVESPTSIKSILFDFADEFSDHSSHGSKGKRSNDLTGANVSPDKNKEGDDDDSFINQKILSEINAKLEKPSKLYSNGGIFKDNGNNTSEDDLNLTEDLSEEVRREPFKTPISSPRNSASDLTPRHSSKFDLSRGLSNNSRSFENRSGRDYEEEYRSANASPRRIKFKDQLEEEPTNTSSPTQEFMDLVANSKKILANVDMIHHRGF